MEKQLIQLSELNTSINKKYGVFISSSSFYNQENNVYIFWLMIKCPTNLDAVCTFFVPSDQRISNKL